MLMDGNVCGRCFIWYNNVVDAVASSLLEQCDDSSLLSEELKPIIMIMLGQQWCHLFIYWLFHFLKGMKNY